MKIKKLLFLFILATITGQADAQEIRFEGVLTDGNLYTYADSVKLDDSYLSVTYKHEHKIDIDSRPLWCNIKMLIGKKAVLQCNMYTHLSNIAWEIRQGGFSDKQPDKKKIWAQKAAKMWENGNHTPPYFSEIIYSPDSNSMQVTCCDYRLSGSNIPWVYREPMPNQQWELRDQIDTVAGYACRTAVAKFRGREWTAWYTTEIPVCAGPWKLNGLPGLILRARDSEEIYAFECVQISTIPEIIYNYQPIKTRPVTRAQYLSYEKRYHDSPESATGKTSRSWWNQSDGSVLEVNSSKPRPYHPIERE